MSLHSFPTPAPRVTSSGVTERRETSSVPNDGGTSGASDPLHVQQMRATLMAAEAAGRPLNVTQLRVIWQHGRSFYYRCAEYYGITLPCFETAKPEVQLAYLSAAAESLRDFPPTRCIKCGMPCDDDGDLYCSKSCSIDAENNR